MGRLILEGAVRRDEDRGHHRQRAKARRHHIAHDVAVIILERPDKSALRADHAGDRVIDQRVKILFADRLKFIPVFFIVNTLEDRLEIPVIGLGDRVLCGEPQILLYVQRVGEACAGEALDGLVQVVDALDDAGALKFMDQFPGPTAALVGKDELRPAGAFHAVLRIFIDVAVRVTGHRDGLFPCAHIGIDAPYQNGRPKDSAVQRRADRPVGALVHFFQIILVHPREVRRDRGALDSDAVLFCGLCAFDGHLIVRLIPVLQPQIIVLCLQIDVGKKKIIFDHAPDDPGHLISVHLHQRRRHLYFAHKGLIPFLYSVSL